MSRRLFGRACPALLFPAGPIALVALPGFGVRLGFAPSVRSERAAYIVTLFEAALGSPDVSLVPAGVDEFPSRRLLALLRHCLSPMKDVRIAVGGTDCFNVFRTSDVFVAEVVSGVMAALLSVAPVVFSCVIIMQHCNLWASQTFLYCNRGAGYGQKTQEAG